MHTKVKIIECQSNLPAETFFHSARIYLGSERVNRPSRQSKAKRTLRLKNRIHALFTHRPTSKSATCTNEFSKHLQKYQANNFVLSVYSKPRISVKKIQTHLLTPNSPIPLETCTRHFARGSLEERGWPASLFSAARFAESRLADAQDLPLTWPVLD